MSGRELSESERRLQRIVALTDDQFDQMMAVATLPPEDFRLIMKIPRSWAFWLGVWATLSAIGAGLAWMVSVAPDRAADVARAAAEHHGP